MTPIILAAEGGHLDAVKLLASKGADLEASARANGATALSRAAQAGHEEVVRFLLDSGTGIEHADVYGNTPLLMAASFCQLPVVKLLVARKANKTSANQGGHTPASMACMNYRDKE
jgi:ankyrin repeat protein